MEVGKTKLEKRSPAKLKNPYIQNTINVNFRYKGSSPRSFLRNLYGKLTEEKAGPPGQKYEQQREIRHRNFVLDCCNPKRSHLREYDSFLDAHLTHFFEHSRYKNRIEQSSMKTRDPPDEPRFSRKSPNCSVNNSKTVMFRSSVKERNIKQLEYSQELPSIEKINNCIPATDTSNKKKRSVSVFPNIPHKFAKIYIRKSAYKASSSHRVENSGNAGDKTLSSLALQQLLTRFKNQVKKKVHLKAQLEISYLNEYYFHKHINSLLFVINNY